MMRTRDYVLGLSIMVFLLVGIGVTLLKQGFGFGEGLSAAVFVASPSDTPTSASVSSEVELSREERIAALRKKIAALGTFSNESEPTQDVVDVATSTPVSDIAVADIAEDRCASYAPFGGVWNSKGVIVEEVEGARIVYRETTAPSVASGTAALPPATKKTLLQLSVKSLPPAVASCIASDVIGITKHGSLIRNHEIAAYKTYDSNALIGYALDGFPIYGGSQAKTDACGGVAVGGQYRYYIHPERSTILSCFAGNPTKL
jgi:hypothetical protein